MVSEKGRDLDSGLSSAKLRACGEEHNPCAMATLLAATRRSERWVSHFSVLHINDDEGWYVHERMNSNAQSSGSASCPTDFAC